MKKHKFYLYGRTLILDKPSIDAGVGDLSAAVYLAETTSQIDTPTGSTKPAYDFDDNVLIFNPDFLSGDLILLDMRRG